MALVRDLAQLISTRHAGVDRLLVAVDGPDAAGKTTLADRLAIELPVVRASIDGFHRARAARLARGEFSPDGYYSDSFDYPALTERLLQPFGGGATHVVTRVFDHRTDAESLETTEVAARAVLVFDGVFLLRPELRRYWHLSIYLDVTSAESMRRALARDTGAMRDVRRRYEQRYLPGQRLYAAEANPAHAADIVVDNTDPVNPIIRRWPD